MRYKNVVIRSRRWAYRITYELLDDELVVFYLYPSWYPNTHPDLAIMPRDPDPM